MKKVKIYIPMDEIEQESVIVVPPEEFKKGVPITPPPPPPPPSPEPPLIRTEPVILKKPIGIRVFPKKLEEEKYTWSLELPSIQQKEKESPFDKVLGKTDKKFPILPTLLGVGGLGLILFFALRRRK